MLLGVSLGHALYHILLSSFFIFSSFAHCSIAWVDMIFYASICYCRPLLLYAYGPDFNLVSPLGYGYIPTLKGGGARKIAQSPNM